MTSTGKNLETAVRESATVTVDLVLLRRVVGNRLRILVTVGLIVFGLSLIAFSFSMPQKFTATTSISMQQSSGSGLGAILGLSNNSNNRYLGVLKSRSTAEKVATEAHLAQAGLFKTFKQGVRALEKSIKLDNNTADGLVYVTVTLPGPPRFGPHTAARRERVEYLVARVANLYAHALREYMRDSDTDKDAVLLREAESKVRLARKQYDDAFADLSRFVRGHRVAVGTESMVAAHAGGTGTASPTALAQLNALKIKQDQLTVAIRSAEAGESSLVKLLSGDVTGMQAEDPLLREARGDLSDARASLNSLRIQFGEANPRVIVARSRVQQAQERLRRQEEAIRRGRTSDEIKLDRLRAELEQVDIELSAAEHEYKYGRYMGAEYERLQSEVEIQLKTLEAGYTQYEQLSLQTVAAQNRMSVVDTAEPAETGSPSLTIMMLISAILAAAVVLAYVAVCYSRAARRPAQVDRAVAHVARD